MVDSSVGVAMVDSPDAIIGRMILQGVAVSDAVALTKLYYKFGSSVGSDVSSVPASVVELSPQVVVEGEFESGEIVGDCRSLSSKVGLTSLPLVKGLRGGVVNWRKTVTGFEGVKPVGSFVARSMLDLKLGKGHGVDREFVLRMGFGRDSVSPCDDGYCYLTVVRPECRSGMEVLLGPRPRFLDLVQMPADVFQPFEVLQDTHVDVYGQVAHVLGEGQRGETRFLTLVRSCRVDASVDSLLGRVLAKYSASAADFVNDDGFVVGACSHVQGLTSHSWISCTAKTGCTGKSTVTTVYCSLCNAVMSTSTAGCDKAAYH